MKSDGGDLGDKCLDWFSIITICKRAEFIHSPTEHEEMVKKINLMSIEYFKKYGEFFNETKCPYGNLPEDNLEGGREDGNRQKSN